MIFFKSRIRPQTQCGGDVHQTPVRPPRYMCIYSIDLALAHGLSQQTLQRSPSLEGSHHLAQNQNILCLVGEASLIA